MLVAPPKTLSGLQKNTLIILVLGLVFFLRAPQASANYDGGLLIDDATFLNAAAMNEQAIQDFFVSKNSGLANKYFYFDCASTGMSDPYYK